MKKKSQRIKLSKTYVYVEILYLIFWVFFFVEILYLFLCLNRDINRTNLNILASGVQ